MSSPLEQIPLIIPFVDGNRILDVACGMGKWGYLLRTNWYCTKVGEGDTEPELLAGIDIFLPFLRRVKDHKIYDGVVRCHVSYLPFKDGSFDVGIASEILEHIEKNEGIKLLNELERVCKKTIIVTTPHILRRRGGLNTPEGFNPYEQHVTRWSIRDLRSFGYRVHGSGFMFFGLLPQINAIFSPSSYFLPELSTHLIGIKHLKEKT